MMDTERAIDQYVWTSARHFLSRNRLADELRLPQACLAPAGQQARCHRSRDNAPLRYMHLHLHQHSRRIETDIRYASQSQACRRNARDQTHPRTRWSASAKRRTPPHLRLHLGHLEEPQGTRLTMPDVMTAILLMLGVPATSVFDLPGHRDLGRQTAIAK